MDIKVWKRVPFKIDQICYFDPESRDVHCTVRETGGKKSPSYLLYMHCPKWNRFPRSNTKCSWENDILCGIFRVVSRFPLHFVLYPRNVYYLLDSVHCTVAWKNRQLHLFVTNGLKWFWHTLYIRERDLSMRCLEAGWSSRPSRASRQFRLAAVWIAVSPLGETTWKITGVTIWGHSLPSFGQWAK